MPRKSSSQRESGRPNGLKYTPSRIHCPATAEPIDPEAEAEHEQDRIDIENFLDTLAEVALAIATRKLAAQQPEGEE